MAMVFNHTYVSYETNTVAIIQIQTNMFNVCLHIDLNLSENALLTASELDQFVTFQNIPINTHKISSSAQYASAMDRAGANKTASLSLEFLLIYHKKPRTPNQTPKLLPLTRVRPKLLQQHMA
jgi:hypothetical protein